VEQQKTRSADIAASLSHDGGGPLWAPDLLHAVGMSALYDGYIIRVYTRDGALVWDAENHDMALCRQIMGEITERTRRYSHSEGRMLSQEHELWRGGQKIGFVTISYLGPYFLSENDFQFLSALNGILIAIGALSVLLAAVTGRLLARRIARPIVKTAEIAKRIAAGDYETRFAGDTHIQEIGELVTAVNSLSAALSEQEALRRQLVADVAHELRTPIFTVSAYLETMLEGIWEATPERIKSCYDEISRLSALLAELEKLAQLESAELDLNKTPVDLLAAAQSVARSLEIELEQKNLSFALSGPPTVVAADRERVLQILFNLISNAAKYTPPGGHIQVEVGATDRAGVISVADDGAGVPEDELPFIFERFYRADKSRNRLTGGSGIGLAIVKSIVTAHGGEVTVVSRLDQGSRFTVSLPK
jgi:signal transduction histidine kinase